MDIPALEATVRNLEHSMGVFTWCLLGSTFIVCLGLILEYWHPVSEFIEELKWPMSAFRWPKFMEIVGGILVTIGVLGELGFTLEVFVLEGRLEKANHDIRDILTAKLGEADKMAKTAISDSSTALSQAKDALSKSGAAESSLGKAEAEAKKAQTASSSALSMAGQARKEADSFEADIVFAKKQATEAESHLAEALERTAHAEKTLADVNARTAPRRLSSQQKKLLIKKLSAFTTKTISVMCFEEYGDEIKDFDDDFREVFKEPSLGFNLAFPEVGCALLGIGNSGFPTPPIEVKAGADREHDAEILTSALVDIGINKNHIQRSRSPKSDALVLIIGPRPK